MKRLVLTTIGVSGVNISTYFFTWSSIFFCHHRNREPTQEMTCLRKLSCTENNEVTHSRFLEIIVSCSQIRVWPFKDHRSGSKFCVFTQKCKIIWKSWIWNPKSVMFKNSNRAREARMRAKKDPALTNAVTDLTRFAALQRRLHTSSFLLIWQWIGD